MRKLKYIFACSVLAIIGFWLSGCGRDQVIPSSQLPGYTDQLVINASVDNVNPIEVKISNTASAYTEDLPTEYKSVNIALKNANSTATIPLTYSNLTNSFVASRVADPGKTYEIVVTDSLGILETVNARTTMPEKVLSKEIGYIENGGKDLDGRNSDLLSIKWIDVAGNNYYVVHFYYYSETADLFIPFDFALNDPTLSAPETVKLIDGGYLFNDALFNGQEKTISVVPPGGLVAGNSDVLYLIELRSVTEDYYKYQTTLQRYRDNDDLQRGGPFGSAVIVHSNINNGLGIFMSSTLESDTIR